MGVNDIVVVPKLPTYICLPILHMNSLS